MSFSSFENQFKKRLNAIGYTVVFPNAFNGIKLVSREGNSTRLSVASEGNIEDGTLALQPFQFYTHRGSDTEFPHYIFDYWIEYAKHHQISRVRYMEKAYEFNNEGGWNNQQIINAALTFGFQVEKVMLNQYGSEDEFELFLRIEDAEEYAQIRNGFMEMCTKQIDSDPSFAVKPFLNLMDKSLNSCYPFMTHRVIWEGFNGLLVFYKESQLTWFEVWEAASSEGCRAERKILEDNYGFTKESFKEVFRSFLEDLQEYQKMINLFSPPCDHLYALLHLFKKSFTKEETTDMMRLFIEKGLTYQQVEAECKRLATLKYPSPWLSMSKNNGYLTEKVQWFGIIQGGAELVVKVLDYYLVVFKLNGDNKKFYADVVETKEEIHQCYFRYVADFIDNRIIFE